MSDAADEFPEEEPTRCAIYTDDIKIYTIGTDIEEMASILQNGNQYLFCRL